MRALFAILAIVATSCADDSTADPTNVLELRMQTTIPAGTEVELCKFVEVECGTQIQACSAL